MLNAKAVATDRGEAQPLRPQVATSLAVSGVQLPLVTIVITNHNYKDYIRTAILSVAQQTYAKFECVIVDDMSTDGSPDLIREILSELDDQRFKPLFLSSNAGQAGAIKAGLAVTSGQFVTSLDADDLMLPEYVQCHVEAHLNAAISASLTASDTLQIDGDGRILEGTFHSLAKQRFDGENGEIPASMRVRVEDDNLIKSSSDGLRYIERGVGGYHVVAMSALMFRRDALDLIIPDDCNDLRMCADWYLFRFAHMLGGTLVIGSVLSCWRMHGRNNFSRNPVVGGRYNVGAWNRSREVDMSTIMGRQLLKNVDKFARLFGPEFPAYMLRKCLERRAIYAEIKRAGIDYRTIFPRLSPTKFQLKYGLLYKSFDRR